MSHKILHLTGYEGEKLAVHARHITMICEEAGEGTYIFSSSSSALVREPYDQVLRMWGEALSEQS